MKKTYLNPEMQVVKVQTQQMLAESFTRDAFGEANGNTNSNGITEADGRDFDLFDED